MTKERDARVHRNESVHAAGDADEGGRGMNDEKPSEPKVDGRPFDGGVGPTA